MRLKSALMATIFLTLLFVLPSGIAYAWSPWWSPHYPPQAQDTQVVITSINKVASPSYTELTLTSSVPSSAVSFKVAPFAPGDSVVISYTASNEGDLPVAISMVCTSIEPIGSGFSATYQPVPSSLSPGKSFTSSITITFASGLGNSYQQSSALLTLTLNYHVGCNKNSEDGDITGHVGSPTNCEFQYGQA